MLQWIYIKRVYIWSVCILATALFISIVHFYKDWVNTPENDLAIVLLFSLWLLSSLSLYSNAVAYTVYGKRNRNNSKMKKGFIISFFSLIMVVGGSMAIWVMIMLTILR